MIEATTAERWLAGLHPDPNHTLAKWACGRTSTLPLGWRVAAIRMPGPLVRSVPKGGGDPGPDLERIVASPVFYVPDEDVYITLTSDPHAYWRKIDFDRYSEYVGDGEVAIPPPSRTTPPGPYWVALATDTTSTALMAWHFLMIGDLANQWRAGVRTGRCGGSWDS